MFNNNTNKKIIFVQEEHKPSPHLVNLKCFAADKEEGRGFLPTAKIIFLKKFLKFFQIGGAPAKSKRDKKFFLWTEKYWLAANRLAIFALIKFLFLAFLKSAKLFYRFCFRLGWLAVFLIRFISIFIFRLAALTSRPVAGLFLAVHSLLADRRKSEKGEVGSIELSAGNLPESSKQTKLAAVVRSSSNDLNLNQKSQRRLGKKIALVFLPFVAAGLFFQSWRSVFKHKGVEGVLVKPAKKLNLKPALLFAVFILSLLLPLKIYLEVKNIFFVKRQKVVGVSRAAVDNMADASELIRGFNFYEAEKYLSNASFNFARAEAEIAEINHLLGILAKITPNRDIKLAANAGFILEAGRLSTGIGAKLADCAAKAPLGQPGDIKEFFNHLYKNINAAAAEAENLEEVAAKIKISQLPTEYQPVLAAVLEKMPVVAGSLRELEDLLNKARLFLGFEENKRYLLVFQNNAEMRASGGFVGSFALVDLANGQIKNIETPGGGSYDTKGGLYEKIASPDPLKLINPRWYFWDANWWPDWLASARKLAWFYERSGGPTVDGVIGFTPTVLERLLAVIGPIDLSEKYGVVFNADNFWQETQDITEERYKEIDLALNQLSASSTGINKQQPKRIIGEMLAKIIEIFPQRLNKDNGLALIKLAENSLAEKHILLYFNDNVLQEKAKDLGWDGRILETAKDYLMVVHTNIAGGKSDRVMSEKIEHTAQVSSDGSVIVALNIKRTHNGVKREKYTGVRNVDWLRVYVPKGSILLTAHGFSSPDEKYFKQAEADYRFDKDLAAERQARIDSNSGTKIYEESGKTVFANWLMVDPGETVTVYLRYRLPFFLKPEQASSIDFREKITKFFNPGQKELAAYSLLVQKQPGSLGAKFSSRLILSENLKAIWAYPENIKASGEGWDFSSDLIIDKFYAALLEVNE